MLDLDDFKLVNDSFGHLYGDGVLVHVAELIRSSLRASDVPARYGGDEFALILPETSAEDAGAVAARMLAAFRETPPADGRVLFPTGASTGIATTSGRAIHGAAAIADRGLRREGRGREPGRLHRRRPDAEPTSRWPIRRRPRTASRWRLRWSGGA
jgi:diguanylate cyclase (GGDEF)-like protein